MKLSEFFEEKNIVTRLEAGDKTGILEELAAAAAIGDSSIDKDELVNVLVQRERLGTTGIGDGVAIPHGKLSGLSHPIVCFAKSDKNLDFESMDGKPTHLFFLLVAPENSTGVHLQVLARIARILKNSALRSRLMECSSRPELYKAIVDADEEA
ncbi:MAG TPA: PTS sugar transporter subunit IIA [Desulfobacteraceae bacterium]|nr:PTS sugar transporter subunit IIA [Desulfobacteraceae bacterium]